MPNNNSAPMCGIRLMLAACLAVAAPAAGGGTAFAADGPEAESAAVAQLSPRDRPDFLFGQPRASGGGLLASFRDYLIRGIDAGGEDIPLGERAHDTVLFRFGGGFSITPRVDLVFDVTPSKSTVASEYRDWEWEGGLPITQATSVWQIPVNAGVRYWVVPRGRRIGRLAWVPNTLAFHVGVGGGTRWYELKQDGHVVDLQSLNIYDEILQSRGWALSGHVSAGASIRMTRRVFAVAEVRRVWSRSELVGRFNGPLDLNGLQMTGGVEFVF